jgi:hypothetical protein
VPKAVILVPAEGNHSSLFQIVAKTLKSKVYNGDACIVGAKLNLTARGATVTLSVLAGTASDPWAKNSASTVITISHGGPDDGPIIKPGSRAGQPWGSNSAGTALRPEATTFWRKVGGAVVKKGGKIILVGCNMGRAHYARNVASAAGVTVYAANDTMAAADNETVLGLVTAIEGGKTKAPMVKFGS